MGDEPTGAAVRPLQAAFRAMDVVAGRLILGNCERIKKGQNGGSRNPREGVDLQILFTT